jgi:hypothetical protein
MTTVPWDFSKAPAPGEPTIPTPASPEGAALGEQIARLCDVEERKQLARFPDQQPRCVDCAARKGTLPNQSAETLMDFVKCVVEGVPFYCHKGMRDDEEPRRICAGWMVLASTGSVAANVFGDGANSRGRSVVCPECLSRDGVVHVAVRGQACDRCGAVCTEPLTPREIRACLRGRTEKER